MNNYVPAPSSADVQTLDFAKSSTGTVLTINFVARRVVIVFNFSVVVTDFDYFFIACITFHRRECGVLRDSWSNAFPETPEREHRKCPHTKEISNQLGTNDMLFGEIISVHTCSFTASRWLAMKSEKNLENKIFWNDTSCDSVQDHYLSSNADFINSCHLGAMYTITEQATSPM